MVWSNRHKSLQRANELESNLIEINFIEFGIIVLLWLGTRTDKQLVTVAIVPSRLTF